MTSPVPGADLLESVDRIRAELGVPFATLADAVGVSTPTIWRTLNGQVKRPDPRLVAACLVYLGRLMERRAVA